MEFTLYNIGDLGGVSRNRHKSNFLTKSEIVNNLSTSGFHEALSDKIEDNKLTKYL